MLLSVWTKDVLNNIMQLNHKEISLHTNWPVHAFSCWLPVFFYSVSIASKVTHHCMLRANFMIICNIAQHVHAMHHCLQWQFIRYPLPKRYRFTLSEFAWASQYLSDRSVRWSDFYIHFFDLLLNDLDQRDIGMPCTTAYSGNWPILVPNCTHMPSFNFGHF